MTALPKGTLINPMARHLEAIGGPLRIAHAGGVYLYDEDGRSWIDCETGSGVFSLGHRPPDVVAAFGHAMASYDLGNHHLISGERARLAEDLNGVLDRSTMRCVFNVSSGESIDCAIKLARGVTGKMSVVSADNSFHGNSGYARAASAPHAGADASALPGFVHIPYGSVKDVERALDSSANVAAVLVEPVAIEAGCIVPPNGFLERVRGVCDKLGALLIVDEAITGLGRTGCVFACAAQGVEADILCVGRALGGGVYPMYATIHRETLDAFYVRNPFVHVSTFGGGEVGCAAARAALAKLCCETLTENVRLRGTEFRDRVASLRRTDHSPICAVRGVGLANAVAFCDADMARAVQRALFERGVLCRPGLRAPESLLFLPPLTIGPDEMADVLAALDASIAAIGG